MIEMGKTGNLIRTINIVDRRAPASILHYVSPACVRARIVATSSMSGFRGVAARVASLQR